jgi:hypothetical protein
MSGWSISYHDLGCQVQGVELDEHWGLGAMYQARLAASSRLVELDEHWGLGLTSRTAMASVIP